MLSIFMGSNGIDRKAMMEELNNPKQAQEQKQGSTIYVGNINLRQEDSVIAKKVKAQKEAMKAILEPHMNEMKMDANVESMKGRRGELEIEAKTAQEEVRNIEEMRNQVKQEYGVTEDGKEPESDAYKEEMKALDEMQQVWQDRADSALEGMKSIGMSLEAIELERVKTHPIVDGMKTSEKILESASKEIAGMLINEAKDHIEETLEEKVEEAEKKAEEEEEKEEKLEKSKDSTDTKNAESAEIAEPILDSDQVQKKLEEEIKKANLLMEDLKGISVDTAI